MLYRGQNYQDNNTTFESSGVQFETIPLSGIDFNYILFTIFLIVGFKLPHINQTTRNSDHALIRLLPG